MLASARAARCTAYVSGWLTAVWRLSDLPGLSVECGEDEEKRPNFLLPSKQTLRYIAPHTRWLGIYVQCRILRLGCHAKDRGTHVHERLERRLF